MAKDLRLALESAAGLPLDQTRTVMQTYQEGLKRGWGDLDFSALVRLLQNEV